MNRYPIFLRDNEAVAVAALGGHIAVSPDGAASCTPVAARATPGSG
jgi:hypothetical protein